MLFNKKNLHLKETDLMYKVFWQQNNTAHGSINSFLKHIGVKFKNKHLLYEAFTHKSASYYFDTKLLLKWNERLEFLGDSVLDLIISTELINNKNNFNEGELSQIRAQMVNEVALAKIGEKFNIQNCIALSPAEESHGARSRESLIADCVESFVGALFLDAGFLTAQTVVLKLFEHVLISDLRCLVYQDSKTLLQEYLQANGLKLPVYKTKNTTGPSHSLQFEVSCLHQGKRVGTGSGKTLKSASQAAARSALGYFNGELS